MKGGSFGLLSPLMNSKTFSLTYYVEAGPRTAEAVERRIPGQVEALIPFLERIRESERVPGARELVIDKLSYIVFVLPDKDRIVVLNVVHTARKFLA